jgi:hypothetical protein
MIGNCNQPRAVRGKDHAGTHGLNDANRLDQNVFAYLIKAGIWLVHHHIFGGAIQGPGNG